MRLFGFLSKFCEKQKLKKAEFLGENKKLIIFSIFIFLWFFVKKIEGTFKTKFVISEVCMFE